MQRAAGWMQRAVCGRQGAAFRLRAHSLKGAIMKKTLIALAVLAASSAYAGPDPALGDQAKVFDRLSGNWGVDYVFYEKDGSEKKTQGDFTFDWVMEGRVQQCLYIIDREAEHKEKYIGTSLTYLDAKSNVWRMVFVDPEADAVITVKGGPVGKDRIVLLTDEENGKISRWSFNDIRADSFIYRDETSRDGGKTWRLNEEDHMTRLATAGAMK
jgi:hypothetical protein